MAEILTSKSGRIATTTTPTRKNPVAETSRRNYRKVLRKTKRA